MATMDLYLPEPKLSFPKTKHASAQLSEDHTKWGQEILNELFKTLPEASEYTPTVSMLEADEEQGYGLGVIIIRSTPDSAMSADRPDSAKASRKVLIPVVIKQHMLLPLDVMMLDKGLMTPLTAERLREGLFKPETFTLMTKDWGDQSLYNIFYPPGRGSNDYASGTSVTASGSGANYIMGPGMKYSMLEDIGPTLNKADLDKIAELVESDPALMHQLQENQVFATALHKLASCEPQLVDDPNALFRAAGKVASLHVAQFGYDSDSNQYWVKEASRNFYHRPETKYMDRKEFYKIAGPEIAKKVDTEGTVTVSDTENPPPLKEDNSNWEAVSKPGIYKVRTEAGKEMMGWVIPGLLDFDGHSMPMSVFTNGAAAIVQSQIMGAPVASGVNLPNDPPQGTGIFYISGEGGIQGTVPVNVSGTEEAMDGSTVLHVTTLTGSSYKLKQVPDLKQMIPAGEDGFVMMPTTVKFLSLSNEKMTPLVGEPDGVDKTAAELSRPQVAVHGDGYVFAMHFTNMPKLASMVPMTAFRDEAVFALCAGGLDAQRAHSVLKQAEKGRTVSYLNDVVLAKDIVSPALERAKTASKTYRELRQELIKEAAVLPDIQTVDSVLSLGFINAENVRTFVSRLPYLEKALSQTCELVLAARIGLSEIPEFAAARAARGLDEVIQGLKSLGMRTVDDEERQQ
jgi:hypothetical protein